ncbi:hypothetical protein CHUAL_011440 [Chamberlinius hualienensis]
MIRWLQLRRINDVMVSYCRQMSSDQLLASRPRRSLLYVPGSSEKKLKKIPQVQADCAVMDCEDGVALNKKSEARETIRQMLDGIEFGRTERSVRVNAIESGLADEDLKSAFGAKREPESLVFPKIENVEHIDWIHDRLTKIQGNSSSRVYLIALIESARAFLNLDAICRRAQEKFSNTRFPLDALIFGSDDFCATIGATRTKSASEVLFARQYFVLVAKAYRLQAIDMVYIDYKDMDGFKTQCVEGFQMGFTGKQIIHPDQVPIAQSAFTPGADKIDWAKQLIAAFEEHQNSGKGAFTFNGSMIDMPTVLQARNILQLVKSFNN